MAKSSLKTVCGLWKPRDASSSVRASGKILNKDGEWTMGVDQLIQWLTDYRDNVGKDVQVLVFKNDRKEKDSHPDFNLCVGEPQDKTKTSKGDM